LEKRSPVHMGELLIALALIALGSFVIYDTQSIAEIHSYSQIGPRLFPNLVGAGLAIFGATLGWQAVSGGWRNVPLDQEGHDAPDRMAFVVISAGVLLHMALIGWAGFILASTLLFVVVARGFGSQRPARDLLLGGGIATLVFFIFTVGLNVSLPKGLLGGA